MARASRYGRLSSFRATTTLVDASPAASLFPSLSSVLAHEASPNASTVAAVPAVSALVRVLIRRSLLPMYMAFRGASLLYVRW
ncbi:hypothetical protein [Corynebacterium efficiens YS-314]|uniref:Uncharacterized protein n=1 Tax=Corynebacterium efficiens (strain DSM 44549 / YS-314 / AJ 12310 / JCM 11189 / NBRC 100395) TaxID=196164 RepID=Q8FPW2_COREF|nr:hypothetical protein [Corynebacterium efficiens YS-314]